MKKGTKVFCIDDEFIIDCTQPEKLRNIQFPKKNIEYTVRNNENFFGIDCILLNEIVNEKLKFDDMPEPIEIAWPANRFKPV